MHIHTRTHIHIHARTHTHIHTHTYMHICTYARHTCTCTQLCVHTPHVHTCTAGLTRVPRALSFELLKGARHLFHFLNWEEHAEAAMYHDVMASQGAVAFWTSICEKDKVKEGTA